MILSNIQGPRQISLLSWIQAFHISGPLYVCAGGHHTLSISAVCGVFIGQVRLFVLNWWFQQDVKRVPASGCVDQRERRAVGGNNDGEPEPQEQEPHLEPGGDTDAQAGEEPNPAGQDGRPRAAGGGPPHEQIKVPLRCHVPSKDRAQEVIQIFINPPLKRLFTVFTAYRGRHGQTTQGFGTGNILQSTYKFALPLQSQTMNCPLCCIPFHPPSRLPYISADGSSVCQACAPPHQHLVPNKQLVRLLGFCPDHTQEPLQLFCVEKGKFFCEKCVMYNEKLSSLTFVESDQVVEQVAQMRFRQAQDVLVCGEVRNQCLLMMEECERACTSKIEAEHARAISQLQATKNKAKEAIRAEIRELYSCCSVFSQLQFLQAQTASWAFLQPTQKLAKCTQQLAKFATLRSSLHEQIEAFTHQISLIMHHCQPNFCSRNRSEQSLFQLSQSWLQQYQEDTEKEQKEGCRETEEETKEETEEETKEETKEETEEDTKEETKASWNSNECERETTFFQNEMDGVKQERWDEIRGWMEG